MQGNPMDMFDEMDEMFARLFSRMDREFMAGYPLGDDYRIVLQNDDVSQGMQEDITPLHQMTHEPAAEVHRIGNEVKVIADLPGITEDSLRLDVKGTTLIIDAGDADHHYRTSASLPLVDTASMQKTLKNGVLEVTFVSLPDPSEKARRCGRLKI